MNKQYWRKILSLVLCAAMIFVSSPEVFAVGLEALSQIDIELPTKASETKSNARVQAVIDKINAIGKVEYTGECLSKIVTAEKAYDALKSDEKLKVTNYGTLKAARAAYDALAADHIDTSSYTVADNGVLGSGVKWFVYNNGALEITGDGAVPTYSAGDAPWYSYASSIKKIIVRSSVTEIGAFAFYNCNNVTDITLPFVGESRTATGYKATFGYIFGYSTCNAALKKDTTRPNSNYLYAVYTSAGECYSDYYYDASNRDIRYRSAQSNAFTNYYVGGSSVNSWYSCYDYYNDKYIHYTGSENAYGPYNLQTYRFYVPANLKAVKITDASKIESAAFNNCQYITKITLNDGITSVGDYAFQNCSSLKDYAIPETVAEIGSYAYYGNTALTEVYIPDAVTKINAYTFYGCKKINRLKISKYAKSIGEYAFAKLNSLPAISIPNNVKEIGTHAFEACNSATALYLPDSVTTIGDYAFSSCSKIAEIAIPDSVTKMGASAFSDCSSVKKLSMGSGVKTIEGYAFENCTGLTSITIPDTVETIAAFAFYNCNNVTDITLPFVGESRTATGYKATFGYIFGYSTCNAALKKDTTRPNSNYLYAVYTSAGECYSDYYYDASNRDIRYRSAQSNAFTNYYVGGSSVNSWYSCYDYYNDKYIHYTGSENAYGPYNLQTYRFYVPANLKAVKITDASKIESAAFNNCQYITKITLNDGITSVGDYAFQNNPWYAGLTDEFVTVGDNVLIKYNGTKSSVTIPDTVKYIGGTVFQNKTSVSEVILPDTLLGIDNLAFDGCTGLSSMTIPKSVVRIGRDAIPASCNIRVYRPSAGYNYRSTNRTVLNGSYTTGNDTYYYIIGDDDTVEIIGCTTSSTELTVPEEINGYTVSTIGDYGFSKCNKLKSITIPTNIKTIGKYAFNECTGLVNATIPTTVGSVGAYAFNNCTGLKNVTISEGVKSIGKGCFYNCTSLVEAVVPDTAEKLGSYAFYNCTSMTTATIGITADAVREYTFYGCTKLDTVVIGISVKSIGNYAFYNCALTKVTVPAATSYIGKYAFANNKAMTKATHRKGLVTIDAFAYQNCSALETVTLPSSLMTIKKGAFQNCAALAKAALPENLTSLGSYAFDGCSSLPTVTIPAGVTVINDCTFNKCTSLATVIIKSNVTSIGFDAFRECAFSAITLPNTVKTIKGGSFRGCAKLAEITIPDATRTIGEAAFFDCTGLSKISVADSLESFGESALKNNNNLTAKIRYLSGTVTDDLFEKQGISHAVLDENISNVGSRAFAYCYNLSDITYGDKGAVNGEFLFSDKLVSIGDEIFKDAFLLKNLIIPDTIETIGSNAFYNSVAGGYHTQNVTVTFYYVAGNIAADILKAQKVSHIVVNDNIKSLGGNAFNSISTLETVSLPDTITTCGDNVFAESSGNVTAYFRGVDGTVDKEVYKAKLSGLTYLVFDENIKTIDSYAFANTSTVKGVLVHNTDTIKDHAFADSTSIYGVVIENAGSIGEYAFNNGSAMNYVEIGKVNLIGKYAFSDSSTYRIELDDICTINDYAFSNCVSMQRVYIDSVVNINDYAFFNDLAINDIVINENLVRIGNHAFEECKLIPKLILPETVREIGECAFYDCNSLQSINIPNGVEKISKSTFFGCASLLAVKLPDSLKAIEGYAYYGCVLVKDLSLGNSVETIGEYAFYNCNQVKEIILPNTLKSIGDYAFRSCSSITEIAIPDSVTSLGDCVFYGCVGLKQAEFGIGITSIGDRVFYACVDLTKLVLNGCVNNIHELAFYGAEDAVIYAFDNQYVEDYCNDMGLEYYNLNRNFTMTLTKPTKLDYIEFEELNTSGLTLDITYENGITRTITTGYQVSGFDSTKFGTQTLTVTYNGQTATFDVTVTAKKVRSISIVSGAPETVIVGQDLDYSNMVIEVMFTDDTTVRLSDGYTVENFDNETLGNQSYDIVYRDGKTTANATVINYIPGDINGDGIVNMKDVTRLVNYLNDNEAYEVIKKALDVNGDGVVSIKDVTRLVEYLNDNTVEIY